MIKFKNKIADSAPSRHGQLKSLFFGGILPVIVFTLLEAQYGIFWGLIGGMILGGGEILVEWITQRKVDPLTWIGNGLLIGMGLFSLWTQEGFWFKLQPAILEAFMAVFLVASVILGKPFMVLMADKQKLFERLPKTSIERTSEGLYDTFRKSFSAMTLRMGIFFAVHSLLAVWAALYWSTQAWALLKGVGFTGSMILYLMVEVFVLRKSIKK